MAGQHAVAIPPHAQAVTVDASNPSYAIQTPRGCRYIGSDAPAFVVHVEDEASWRRLSSGGAYRLATAFVEGAFDVSGDLVAAVRWAHSHVTDHSEAWKASLISAAAGNVGADPARARHDIQFHYDRSNRFYEQFLDSRMIYSSASFSSPGMSLDDAQRAKLDHVCRTLNLWARRSSARCRLRMGRADPARCRALRRVRPRLHGEPGAVQVQTVP